MAFQVPPGFVAGFFPQGPWIGWNSGALDALGETPNHSKVDAAEQAADSRLTSKEIPLVVCTIYKYIYTYTYIYIYIYIYIYVYTYTYTHACIHACIHRYIQYIHTVYTYSAYIQYIDTV